MTKAKKESDDKVKIVLLTATRGIKAGATRTLSAEQAKTLIEQGHAREA